MKIIGCLSWYNESPSMLAACVQSLTFIDHLVAVDGAYATFPSAHGQSPSDQAQIIRDACQQLQIGCTIHTPREPWIGDEVAKRTFMFRLAEAHTNGPEDWYYIADADERVTHVIEDPHDALNFTDLDAGEVTYWWHREHGTPDERPFTSPLREQTAITKLFRAIPGLHVDQAHYRFRTPNGRLLWNPAGQAEETLSLRDTIRVQHRNAERDLWRAQEAQDYYRRRDEHKLEAVTA